MICKQLFKDLVNTFFQEKAIEYVMESKKL